MSYDINIITLTWHCYRTLISWTSNSTSCQTLTNPPSCQSQAWSRLQQCHHWVSAAGEASGLFEVALVWSRCSTYGRYQLLLGPRLPTMGPAGGTEVYGGGKHFASVAVVAYKSWSVVEEVWGVTLVFRRSEGCRPGPCRPVVQTPSLP